MATLHAQTNERCLGQETGPVFDLELIRHKQKEKKLEIVRRLLEEGSERKDMTY